MPVFAGGPFLKAGRRFLAACEPVEQPIDKVAYFVDTYVNHNDHELGFAVIEVLRQNSIDVILPNQRPAPLPAISYGDVKTARRDLSYNVKYLAKAVREGCKVVCSEPSAALCLQQELRHYVTDEDAKLVSTNTYELMGYLLDLFKQGKLKPVAKPLSRDFVYHCPCHLWAIGAAGASSELLTGLCGVSVVDLSGGCCGLAGTFGMQKKNYELSSQIADEFKMALDKSSAKYVLTECSGCKMQIQHISNCVVTHPIKVLAEAYQSA
jgi:Fe-S oxidoreductase